MRIFKSLAITVAIIVSAQAMAGSSTTSAKGDAEKGKEIAAGTCAGCHNPDGNSIIPINPILAGQHADYTVKQLMEFKESDDGEPVKRANPVMGPMAAPLSQEDIIDLGAFYAQQAPQAGINNNKNEDLLELGEIIYRGGILENEVAACASCHGPDGAGIPPNYPRVAGQHADYTYGQLRAFNKGERANDNEVMQKVVTRMSAREKRAVSAFITSLK